MCPWLSQTGHTSQIIIIRNTLLCTCYLVLTVILVYNLTEIKCHGVSKTLLLHENVANWFTNKGAHT